jgi:hypothetical protein
MLAVGGRQADMSATHAVVAAGGGVYADCPVLGLRPEVMVRVRVMGQGSGYIDL